MTHYKFPKPEIKVKPLNKFERMIVEVHAKLLNAGLKISEPHQRTALTNILHDVYFQDRNENMGLFFEARDAYIKQGPGAFDNCYRETLRDTQGQFVLKTE